MFNLKNTQTTLALLSLILSFLSLGLADLNVLAVTTNLSPEIILKQKSFNYEGGKWQETNETKWTKEQCQNLYGKGVKGIADYEDGISKNVIKRIKSDPKTSSDVSFDEGIKSIPFSYRDCLIQNENAKNVDGELDPTISSPKHDADLYAFYKKPASKNPKTSFTPANNPVFAYQFQYNYQFPSDKKTQLSDTYRSKTGLEGDYEGVLWTYTYFTYKEVKETMLCTADLPTSFCQNSITLGDYKPWTNPNQDNSNRGWLIYGIADKEACENCDIDIDLLTTTINTEKSPLTDQDLTATIKYDRSTKTISWNGRHAVNSSSCTQLLKSEIIATNENLTDYKKYYLELTFKPVAANQPCTADLGERNFSGSQTIDLNDLTLENFNNAFTFKRS